jgi:hypothetical protein
MPAKGSAITWWQETKTEAICRNRMKPLPPPSVPGNTDARRMSNALRMVLTVSKDELLKKEARLKRASAKKRATKKSKALE